MTDPRPQRTCIDRVIPWEHRDDLAAIARSEEPANERLGVVLRKTWKNGRTLKIGFRDGSRRLRDRVEEQARTWTRHANLHFDFTDYARAEIRISFREGKDSWSAIGIDAKVDRAFPDRAPTMNLGWLDDDTPDTEVTRVVLHEFGHALGCIHEHQVPAGGIVWNEAAVLAYYGGPPNDWEEQTIRHNILEKYASSQLNGDTFDPDSIMLYALPPGLAMNGLVIHENQTLSAGDIAAIAKMYPRPR